MRKEYSTAIIAKDVHRLVKRHCANKELAIIDFYTKAAIRSLPSELVKSKKKIKK